jgi:hypothetical protein
MSQEAFYQACQTGALAEDILVYLKSPYVDPTLNQNYAIRAAAFGGHANIVRVLLADTRVDPCAVHNNALCEAICCGHAEVVRVLLADARIDPSLDDSLPIRWAALYNRVELMRLLLTYPRVSALGAIQHISMESARFLAADERFGVEQNRALYMDHHPSIVQQYDNAIAQGLTMAFVAKQQRSWESIVEPVAKRLKAGCFEFYFGFIRIILASCLSVFDEGGSPSPTEFGFLFFLLRLACVWCMSLSSTCLE